LKKRSQPVKDLLEIISDSNLLTGFDILMDDSLEIVEMNEEHTPSILRLLSRGAGEMTREFLKWKYQDTPANQRILARDTSSNEVAGYYAVIPWPLFINSEKINAVQSVDTIVDSRYRRRGIMKSLGLECYSRAWKNGAKLMIGWSRGAALNGLVNRMGWREIGGMPVMVYPIRPFKALAWTNMHPLKRLLAGIALRFRTLMYKPKKKNTELMTIDIGTWNYEAFSACWKRSIPDDWFSVFKDTEFYKKRFIRSSYGDVEIVPISISERGIITSFAICVIHETEQGKQGIIADLHSDLNNIDSFNTLLFEVISHFKKSDSNFIRLWAIKPSWMIECLRKSGFIVVSRALKFIIHPLSESNHLVDEVSDISQWDLNICDSDHV